MTEKPTSPPLPSQAQVAAAALHDKLADALEEPAFLDDEGPSADIPPFITTTNIRELYDWKPGESLDEAIARKKAQEG